MNRKVIYTCLTGKYDSLKDPDYVKQDWDYICFTDDLKQSDYKIWNLKQIPFKSKSKIVLSRFPKINPHLVLPEYEYSIYHDSNINVVNSYIYDRAEELINQNVAISIPRHPYRKCIYDEAETCIREGRSLKKPVIKLTAYLKSQHFPEAYGLFENNFIFREHKKENIKLLSNAWWDLFYHYAKRDQLSLVFLLWKFQISCMPFFKNGSNVRNHYSIKYYSHNVGINYKIKCRIFKLLNHL